MLLPFVNSYVVQHAPSHLHPKVTAFRATPSALSAKVTVNERLHLDFHGPVSWLKKRFDLHYRLYGQGVRIGGRLLPGTVDLAGKMHGDVRRFSVDGNGTGLDAQLGYRFDVVHKEIRDIDADIKGGDLEGMLLLAGVRPTAKGRFDLHLRTPGIDTHHPDGKADITLYDGLLDKGVVSKRFGVALAEDLRFSGEGHLKLHETEAKGWGALKTSLGSLVFKESRYDIARKDFDSQYHLFLPKLSAFGSLTGHDLRGSAEVVGHIYQTEGKLRLEGVTESFGGKIVGVFENGEAVAVMKDLSLKKVLYDLAYPQVADGGVFARMRYNLPAQSGEINGTIQDARFLENQLTRAVAAFEEIDLRKERFEKTVFSAQIKPYQIFFTLDAAAPKSHIRIYDAQIKTALHFIDAKFDIDLHGKAFGGRVKGDLSGPQVELDTARYIKSRLGRTVDKYIDKEDQQKIKNVVKEQMKKFGLDDLKGEDMIKGMMDIFF
ncbi:MAG: hypothetical protein DSZ05_06910 [Sulfurospirillum sp.]|nr:MAG: hypothetical protein DSZ05_06910 [Sulfurospirillum sp.]